MTGSIRPIDGASVHRIHSGQVVLDLQGAIKELVENSLDAGATSIEVRIKDHGLDGFEVIDNGAGIAHEDWGSIALKHHTSKLPSLELLHDVSTFGFRGEALSALCALCESVTITTATSETAPMGAIIVLGRDGGVVDDTGRVARPRGTTVSLVGLFSPLPVRRKEFERNAKRELSKALTLLTAYCLVPASATDDRGGVRLKVETISGKKRNTVLINDGRGNLRAGTVGVWGPKALDGVLDLDVTVEFEVEGRARRDDSQARQSIRVVGLVSTASWGQGRSSSDRQYFYVNGRPCDLKSIQKAINETYKSFNTHQLPLLILDFQIPRDAVDINVSPDKRTIMLHSEGNLIAALREKLEEWWSPSRSEYVVGGATQGVKALRGLTQTQLPGTLKAGLGSKEPEAEGEEENEEEGEEDEGVAKDVIDQEPDGEDGQEGGMEEEEEGHNEGRSQAGEEDEEAEEMGEVDELSSDQVDTTQEDSQASSRRVATQSHPSAESLAGPSRRRRAVTPVEIITLDEGEDELSPAPVAITPPVRSVRPSFRRSPAGIATPPKAVEKILKTSTASWSPDRLSKGKGKQPSSKRLRDRLAVYASQAASQPIEVEDEDGEDAEAVIPEHQSEEVDEVEETPAGSEEGGEPEQSAEVAGSDDEEHVNGDGDVEMEDPSTPPEDEADTAPGEISNTRGAAAEPPEESPAPRRRSLKRSHPSEARGTYRDEIITTSTSGSMTLHFDLPRLQARYSAKRSSAPSGSTTRKDAYTTLTANGISHAAGISNTDAPTAEAALSRVITKNDFAQMEVLGQFNKGFIISRLQRASSDDLFIIDQHASDEKFNFETLQHTTVIKAQKLIRPRPLQLTAGDEIVAMENLDILRANGFEVDIVEDAPPGRGERVRLVAMPVSKETTFDVYDLEQLIHLLGASSRSSGQMVRCSKARAMFAMRACRKSVMIGKSLTQPQMTGLLRNMGTIDQPWNCPHGRPTMRHLTKIDHPSASKRRIDWSKWTPSADG